MSLLLSLTPRNAVAQKDVTVGYTECRMSPTLRRYLPTLVLLLALALRLWGIGWGLPDERHAFSYHPDESRVVGQAVLQPGQNLLDTGFYNYGSLATLTDRFLLIATGAASVSLPSPSSLLLVRLVTVVYGVATCALLLLLGKRLAQPQLGLIASTLYAVCPLAVQHGHFATVDVAATFWVTAALVAALTSRKWLLIGTLAGLAAATKYNAGLVLLSGVAAWALSEKRTLSGLLLLLAGATLGFIVGCPGVLINSSQFWKDFSFELAHSRRPDEYFLHSASGFLYWPTLGLTAMMGSPLTLLGVARGLLRREKPDVIVLAFVVPYFLLLCLSENQFVRYGIPLLPALCWLLAQLPWRLVVGVAGALSLAFAVGLCSVMAGTDPRDAAATYLKQKGVASVGFARGPWFWSPPLHPGLSSPIPPAAKQAAESSENVRLFATPNEREWDVTFLEETNPEAVALSEIEYTAALAQKNPKTLAYLAALRARYPTRTVFTHPLPILGVWEPLPRQPLPIDMLYTNPTIVIFTK